MEKKKSEISEIMAAKVKQVCEAEDEIRLEILSDKKSTIFKQMLSTSRAKIDKKIEDNRKRLK